MDVYEITGVITGVSQAGVNYLQPADSFTNIVNGFINRQVLQSRQGVGFFAPRLAGNSRIMGIFEHTLPDDTKQLLAFDTNQLYRFNIGTGVFDPIPFGGSLAGYPGFGISSLDDYISGTSYPDKNNGNAGRFVFTSPGILPSGTSSLFFYDGTVVKNFTNAVDNPDYVAPPQGPIAYANYVIWFNERLNLVAPNIGGVNYNQGVLYSGIRNSSGNGDKFNVPGAGLFQADTPQFITGATINGQILQLNFDRMAYVLEKTRDAFNPYFGRRVPGPLGTNAKFSAVLWDDNVRSLGKTGVLTTNGRENLRADNKIPEFTQNEIDQVNFNIIYGGFDRQYNQFLWSYRQSETEIPTSGTQNMVLVFNYEENSWSVFDQRFSVFGQTDIGLNLTWDDIDETSGNKSWAKWDTTEDIWDKIGIGEAVQKTLAGDDLGFIYQLDQDYDDYFADISSITQGATTTLNISATGIQKGDLVSISDVIGLLNDQGNSGINNFDPETNTQIGDLYTVINSTPTSVEINLDSSLLTAYVSGGHITKVITFSAETIPFNPYRSIGRRCYVSHVEFYISKFSQLKVDVLADQDQSPFKQNVLCSPNLETNSEYQWVNMSVNQEANFITFILKQQSPSVQFKMTSMRIHCSPGGLTSG
jgi:hypothetical protein